MNDLISRQAAIDLLEERLRENGYSNTALVSELNRSIGYIMRLPAIDPVKHGRWIKYGEPYALYKCSACNDLWTVAGYANCVPEEHMYKTMKYCPNCGAKMEKERKLEYVLEKSEKWPYVLERKEDPSHPFADKE